MRALLIFGCRPCSKTMAMFKLCLPLDIAVHTSTSILPAKILPAKIGLKYLTNINLIHTF